MAYLSWPIGYSVNRVVVERGLASDLEVPGQPFSWLFILLDIVSGILMLWLSIAAWRGARWENGSLRTGGLIGYGFFGLSTILSAAVPLSCGTGRAALLSCGTNADTYGWHDILGAVGYLTLFFSLIGAMIRSYRGHAGWIVGPFVTAVVHGRYRISRHHSLESPRGDDAARPTPPHHARNWPGALDPRTSNTD
jgi:hypothetical protein